MNQILQRLWLPTEVGNVERDFVGNVGTSTDKNVEFLLLVRRHSRANTVKKLTFTQWMTFQNVPFIPGRPLQLKGFLFCSVRNC